MELGSPPTLAEGLTEEEMWPAATAEGWSKPVLVKWQRSFEDALAVVSQVVGVDTWVQIAYHRPAVRDRNVWEDVGGSGAPIVPRDGNPPWRAGANEVTTIEFSGDVQVEGIEVPAGKYAFFVIPGDDVWTLILNEDTAQRGSGGQYDAEKDVARIQVAPQRGPKNEHLTYAFTNCEAWSTLAWLRWDRMHVPFEIEVRATR